MTGASRLRWEDSERWNHVIVCRLPFSAGQVPRFVLDGAGEGIRTPDGLLGRHIALYGVAALVAGGAKAVQLSSREMAL